MKIITISGSGRTGSTLLSLLLSQQEGAFNLGQARDLWAAYDKNAPCSCDEPLTSCRVYSPAITATFPEQADTTVKDMRSQLKAFFKDAAKNQDWKNADVVAALKNRHQGFISSLGTALQHIQSGTGADYFVDSSKSPEFALALSMLDDADVFVLNLARDPRAVACSWKLRNNSLKTASKKSREWSNRQRILWNWSQALGDRFRLLRYEDLTTSPRQTIADILDWAGLPAETAFFTDENTAEISWANQHLYPPANERILSERKTTTKIIRADKWQSLGNLHIHLLAILFSFPYGWKYIRNKH